MYCSGSLCICFWQWGKRSSIEALFFFKLNIVTHSLELFTIIHVQWFCGDSYFKTPVSLCNSKCNGLLVNVGKITISEWKFDSIYQSNSFCLPVSLNQMSNSIDSFSPGEHKTFKLWQTPTLVHKIDTWSCVFSVYFESNLRESHLPRWCSTPWTAAQWILESAHSLVFGSFRLIKLPTTMFTEWIACVIYPSIHSLPFMCTCVIPQVCFETLVSAATVCSRVLLNLPLSHLPSGVQWREVQGCCPFLLRWHTKAISFAFSWWQSVRNPT